MNQPARPRSLPYAVTVNARYLREEIERDDLVMAHCHAVLLGQQAKELQEWPSDQVSRLPAPDWAEPSHPPARSRLTGPTDESAPT